MSEPEWTFESFFWVLFDLDRPPVKQLKQRLAVIESRYSLSLSLNHALCILPSSRRSALSCRNAPVRNAAVRNAAAFAPRLKLHPPRL